VGEDRHVSHHSVLSRLQHPGVEERERGPSAHDAGGWGQLRLAHIQKGDWEDMLTITVYRDIQNILRYTELRDTEY